jgi:hypothetical protein
MASNVVRLPLLGDSFKNLLAGLGVWGRDKAVSQEPTFCELSPRDLKNLYRGDWISRKIVDLPAYDSSRAWRMWQADQKEVQALEEQEKVFGLQRKLMIAMTRARLYGGAAIVLGVEGTGEFHEELKLDKVKKGSLKFVHVVERWHLAAGARILDITSPWFGEPLYYQRSNNPILPAPGNVAPPPSFNFSEAQGGDFFIHPSRVIRLIGLDYPDVEEAPDAWGDSVLQPVYEAVQHAGMVNSSMGQMIAEAKVDIIKVDGLTELLGTEASAQKLVSRFGQANAAKSVINMLLLDKTSEEFERKELRLSNLDKVMQMYLLICAGAADIPATRLLGREPAGQNATGESDVRNYYDRVSSDQKVRLTPLLTPLDEVLIRHTFGSRPDDITYDWRPLWQMSDTEKATIVFQKAQAHKIDVDNGLINPDVLRIARENDLVEDGFLYPGFKGAQDEGDPKGDFDVEEFLAPPQPFAAPPGNGNSGAPPTGGKPNPGKPSPFGNSAKDAWEEEGHPRGTHGKFTENGSQGNANSPPKTGTPSQTISAAPGTRPAFNQFITDTISSTPSTYQKGVGALAVHTWKTTADFANATGDPTAKTFGQVLAETKTDAATGVCHMHFMQDTMSQYHDFAAETVAHEMMHCIDNRNNISGSQAFQQAYTKDVNSSTIAQISKDGFAHYTIDNGREALAEAAGRVLIATTPQNDAGFFKNFPATSAFVASMFHSLGMATPNFAGGAPSRGGGQLGGPEAGINAGSPTGLPGGM